MTILNRGFSLAAVLGLAFGAITPAASAAPAKKKDTKAQAKSKSPDHAGPESFLAGDVRRKKAKEDIKPQVDYDAFRFQLELQVADKRRAQMDTLQKIIQLGTSDKEMPDLLFRYAELAWEESRYFFFEANRKDDEWLQAKQKDDQAGMAQAQADKEALMKKSASWQAEAIARYKQIGKKYPNYPRMDEVFYFLGHNLWDDNQEKEALAVYKALITRFPQSRYVPDAYLAFGEFYFNGSNGQRGELSKALAAYQKAASYPENKVYLYALYKEGWCFYNLGDFGRSLEMFKTVIQIADLQSSLNSGNKLKLAKDARRDYVLAYSRYGSPLAAKDDFQKVGGPENWWPMLKGLAGLYYDDGKDKEAILVYRDLIREKPLSPDAPFFQARVVDAAMRIGNKKYTSEQAKALVKVLQDVETSGVIKTDQDKKLVNDARELAERTLSNLAVTWHNEGKKTRDDETLARANDAYAFYLTIFPAGPKSYDLHFYHGELLFDNLQRYQEAAQEYDKVTAIDVARIGKGQKPGRWFAKATEDAVFAWEEVMKAANAAKVASTPKADGAAKPRTAAAQPIPVEAQGMLAACELYLKYFPKGERATDVAYKSAHLYYDYNHLPDAIRLFNQIVENHPESDLARYAADLILDSYNILGDYQAVVDAASRFLGSAKLAHAKTKEDVEFREHLPVLIEESGFKLIEGLERKQQFEEAGEKYVAFAQQFPKNPHADLSLWNAANDFGKSGNFQQAIEVRKKLIHDFPHSKYTPKALYGNGQLYDAAAEFDLAAAVYEAYTGAYEKQILQPSDESRGKRKNKKKELVVTSKPARADVYEESKAKDGLLAAAVYRVGLKQYAEAIRDRELYLKLWPAGKGHNLGDSQSEKVFASIADVQEQLGQIPAAIKQLEEHETHIEHDANAVMALDYRLAKLYAKAHNQRMADKLFEQILDLGKRVAKKRLTPEALEALGQASYQSHQPNFAAFDRIKLRLPETELIRSVKAKGAALAEVRKAYSETVELRVAGPAICSLWKVATAEQLMAQALYDAPVPAKLRSNEQLESAYKDALAQQAQPVENAAKNDFKSALEQGRALGIYGGCAEKSLEALRRYDPQAYAEPAESIATLPLEQRTLGQAPAPLTATLAQPGTGAQQVAAPPSSSTAADEKDASAGAPAAPQPAASAPSPGATPTVPTTAQAKDADEPKD